MWFLNMGRHVQIPVLNDAVAIDLGANLIGETVTFSITSLLLLYQYRRSVTRETLKEVARDEEIATLRNSVVDCFLQTEEERAKVRMIIRRLGKLAGGAKDDVDSTPVTQPPSYPPVHPVNEAPNPNAKSQVTILKPGEVYSKPEDVISLTIKAEVLRRKAVKSSSAYDLPNFNADPAASESDIKASVNVIKRPPTANKSQKEETKPPLQLHNDNDQSSELSNEKCLIDKPNAKLQELERRLYETKPKEVRSSPALKPPLCKDDPIVPSALSDICVESLVQQYIELKEFEKRSGVKISKDDISTGPLPYSLVCDDHTAGSKENIFSPYVRTIIYYIM